MTDDLNKLPKIILGKIIPQAEFNKLLQENDNKLIISCSPFMRVLFHEAFGIDTLDLNVETQIGFTKKSEEKSEEYTAIFLTEDILKSCECVIFNSAHKPVASTLSGYIKRIPQDEVDEILEQLDLPIGAIHGNC